MCVCTVQVTLFTFVYFLFTCYFRNACMFVKVHCLLVYCICERFLTCAYYVNNLCVSQWGSLAVLPVGQSGCSPSGAVWLFSQWGSLAVLPVGQSGYSPSGAVWLFSQWGSLAVLSVGQSGSSHSGTVWLFSQWDSLALLTVGQSGYSHSGTVWLFYHVI